MTEKFKVIMGWNIGNEGSRACARIEKDIVEPLYLHKMRGVRIERTAVAKSKSGMIIIGEEASHQREWAINFV